MTGITLPSLPILQLPTITSLSVNYSTIIGNQRVVYFEQSHHHSSLIAEMIQQLPDLRRAGFTHLALGMFSSASQNMIDFYRRKEVTYDEVVNLQSTWDEEIKDIDRNFIPPHPSIYFSYPHIIDAALAVGLHIQGIRWSPSAPLIAGYDPAVYPVNNLWDLKQFFFERNHIEVPDLDDIKARGDIALANQETPEEIYSALFKDHAPIHNWHGAHVIASLLQDPAARVAVFASRRFIGKPADLRSAFTLNRFLEAKGIHGATVSYAISGYARSSHRTIADFVGQATLGLELGSQRFMLDLRGMESSATDMTDFVIHLP